MESVFSTKIARLLDCLSIIQAGDTIGFETDSETGGSKRPPIARNAACCTQNPFCTTNLGNLDCKLKDGDCTCGGLGLGQGDDSYKLDWT